MVHIEGFVPHHVTVSVPLESDPYEKFLEANRLLEQAREKFGYITPEALEKYRQAVAGVDKFARELFAGDRAKP